MTTYRKFDQVLAASLEDPEVRAEWERTALARELAIWLLRYRQQHGLTQTRLAGMLRWRQPMIARLERAEHEPSIATLQYLGAELGLRTKLDITGDQIRVQLLDDEAPTEHTPRRSTGSQRARKHRAAPRPAHRSRLTTAPAGVSRCEQE